MLSRTRVIKGLELYLSVCKVQYQFAARS